MSWGPGAEFNFSANAGLDAGRVEFNNTNVSMARGAIFTMEEYNADEKGSGNRFAFTGDADPRAVVLISEKAYTRKGHETYFSGAIEVVYDNDRDKDYTIRKDYLTDGAVMSASPDGSHHRKQLQRWKGLRKSRSGAGTRRVCERSRTYLYLLLRGQLAVAGRLRHERRGHREPYRPYDVEGWRQGLGSYDQLGTACCGNHLRHRRSRADGQGADVGRGRRRLVARGLRQRCVRFAGT